MKRPSLAPKKIPAWAWKRLKFPARKPQAGPRRLPAWFWAWRKWRLAKPATPVVVQPITMYDSVDVTQIPANARAVAGYVNGRWPTFSSLVSKFPHAYRLSIAVTAAADAECLDVEKGDAEPFQAGAWVKRQLERGVKRPAVYTSVSQAAGVLAELARNGIRRDQIRLWTAHYTFKAHRCSSECGFGFTGTADATQYDDHALGKNLDASLCSPTFFE